MSDAVCACSKGSPFAAMVSAAIGPLARRPRIRLRQALVATRYSHARRRTSPVAAGGLLNALRNTSWVMSFASSRSPRMRAHRLYTAAWWSP